MDGWHDNCPQAPALPDSGYFLKSVSRLVPNGWVGLKSFGYRCHFRAFQLELDTLDTQNIGNGPVVEELQPLEVGRISEIPGNSTKKSSKIIILCSSIEKLSFSKPFRDLPKSVSLISVNFFTHPNASYGCYI